MVSIRDIAKKTGLSIATISRHMNSSGYVSEEAARKIDAAINDLGYVPNQHARAIFEKSSKIVGLIFPSLVNPFFAQLATILGNLLQESGYSTILCFTEDDPLKESEVISTLLAYRVDGVIACRSCDVSNIERLNVPIVSIESPISDGVLVVSADNFRGGEIAFQHLYSRGCRKLLHIKGPHQFIATQDRCRGFLSAASKYDLPVEVIESFHDYSLSEDETSHWIGIDFKKYDGIFVFNDINALYVISKLQKSKIRVPDDIKVIGFDNSYLTQLVEPQLTTIEQEVSTMAKQCFKHLMARMSGELLETKKAIIPVKLIQRGTT